MTEWSGEISGDTRWRGDVAVAGDVVVPAGSRLSIEAGARIRFAPRPQWSCSVFRSAPEGYPIEASERELCDIVVLGRLDALGTPENPILIGEVDVSWGGIIFLGRARGALRHCFLRTQAEYALQTFDDARLDMAECSVENAEVAIVSRGFSLVKTVGGRLRATRCGAIACEGSQMRLNQTEIADSPQGCCAEDWALTRAEKARFAANQDFSILARGHSWARLDACVFDGPSKTLKHDHARIDVR